jgi:Exocyst complex component Sec10
VSLQISCSFMTINTKPSCSSIARLETTDMKTEPTLQPLNVLHSADLICHLWQRYVNVALFPLASTSVTVRREMVVYNNQAVSRIEGAANSLIQRLVDCESGSSLTPKVLVVTVLCKWISYRWMAISTIAEAEKDRLQTSQRRLVVRQSQH